MEDIVSDLSFELTLPYIMYRNTADEVLGCPDASASVHIISSMLCAVVIDILTCRVSCGPGLSCWLSFLVAICCKGEMSICRRAGRAMYTSPRYT